MVRVRRIGVAVPFRALLTAFLFAPLLAARPAYAGDTTAVLPKPLTVPISPSSSSSGSATSTRPPTPKSNEPEGLGRTPTNATAKMPGSESGTASTTRPEIGSVSTPARVRRRIPEPVEPANGRVRLIQDAYVFVRPTRWSRHTARVHARYYVNVTGTTEHYVRVRLRSGKVGFVPMTAVALTVPTKKVLSVFRDSPVYETPNIHSRHVARLYTPGKVLVIGAGLGYLKVRMHDGVEGYVPEDVCE